MRRAGEGRLPASLSRKMTPPAALRPFTAAAALAAVLASGLAHDSWAHQGLRGVSLVAAQAASAFSGAGRLTSAYVAPLSGLAGFRALPYRAAAPIDEDYRQAFAECDATNRFRGYALGAAPGCQARPNRTEALLRLPSGAVYIETHLNLDLAGSDAACAGAKAARPACATFFDYPSAPIEAFQNLRSSWREVFLSNEATSFVTIPLPVADIETKTDDAIDHRAFVDKTGLSVGDVGVVFYRDRFAPVIIGNAGPAHQALAGSLGLFEALGVSRCRAWADADEKNRCRSVRRYGLGANVVGVFFPGSSLGDITPDTIMARVEEAAFARLAKLVDPRMLGE